MNKQYVFKHKMTGRYYFTPHGYDIKDITHAIKFTKYHRPNNIHNNYLIEHLDEYEEVSYDSEIRKLKLQKISQLRYDVYFK